MKPDEKFVVDTLVSKIGGIASEGDDPPDAFVRIDGKTIGIEVSQLVQRIIEDSGPMRSRATDDAPGISIVVDLDKEIGHRIPNGQFVSLILFSPISKVRRTKQKLSSVIQNMAEAGIKSSEEVIFDNRIQINFYDQPGKHKKKISGGIFNRYSTTNIGENARMVLEDRIFQKNRKISSSAKCDEWWLALLNNYCLADLETYQREYQNVQAKHSFSRIYVISDRSDLIQLC